mgnify:CR=1 FL=1|tara:strand:- start:12423 stop:12683 length:261 start_codon:yes stop_codon:yes gene_type:complete
MYEEQFEILFLLAVEHHLTEAYKAKEEAAAALDAFPHKGKRQRAHQAAKGQYEQMTKNAIQTVKNLSMDRLIDESFPILYRLINKT